MSGLESDHHVLSLRVEYGSWEYTLYWGCEVDFEALELRVTGEAVEGGHQSFKLTSEQAQGFFKDAEKLKIFALPSTNYDADHTDDLYHMGVSVRVASLESRKRFVHQVPTGSVVMVPTRGVTKAQYISFSSFVQLCVRRATNVSKIPPPDFILAKWKSRSHLDSLQ